tara:strand:- start:82 stop:567 length:486 start_codon:yes stop_codon:yes gene_type:complete
MNFKELNYNVFMQEFELDDFMDRGCPSCGAEAGEDCDEACIPMEAPPSLYAMIEEQMEYVAHKVYQNIIKKFKSRLLTEKTAEVMQDWGYLTNLCQALMNAGVINHKEQVLKFFENPNIYKRHYVVWNELGNPLDKDSETWSMFKEAITNTEKRNPNGQQT